MINRLQPPDFFLLRRCIQMENAVLRHQVELVPVALRFQDALSDTVDTDYFLLSLKVVGNLRLVRCIPWARGPSWHCR